MSNHTDDDLPSELREVADGLRAPHIAASDRVLMSAKTRAEGARASRKSPMLWASMPRMSGRMRGIAVASALALVGMTGAAVAVNSSGSGGGGLPVVDDAANAQYVPGPGNSCPGGSSLVALNIVAAQILLATLAIDPIANATVIAYLEAQIELGNNSILICLDL